MSLTEPERFLGPRQLAAYLNVSVATVYDWRHRRCGPPGFRVGKHVRYRRSDVDRWIDNQKRSEAERLLRLGFGRFLLVSGYHRNGWC